MREITRFILNNWLIVLPIAVFAVVLPFALSKYFPSNPTLSSLKQALKIVLTSRINLLIIFIITYIVTVISGVVNDDLSLGQSLFGSLYSVLGYGIMLWIGFILSITILDILLFGLDKRVEYTNTKLLLEWAIISAPLVYWIIKYNQWVLLAAIIAFLVGQMIRKSMVLKILTN